MLQPRRFSRTLALVLAVVLLSASLAPVGASPSAPNGQMQTKHAAGRAMPQVDFWLTVLHNNDGESQLVSSSGLPDFGGAARFKTLVDNLKHSALTGMPNHPGAKRGVVMVSSGDNFLAGPEFTASLANGVPFYDTIAMDLIGYDAVALGNHDFDFGPDVLADFIEGYTYTHPPYLSSNLDYSGEPRLQALFEQGRIAHSTVVKERGEMIGIIGATTPNLPFNSSPRNVGVDPDVAGAVQAEVDMLESMGIDKIILISHLQNIEEDIALAAEVTGLDVMVAGGGDEILANPDDLLIPGHEEEVYGPYPVIAQDGDGHDIPVVTTAGNYGYVGRLVVGFDKEGEVIWIDEDHSGPVRVAGGDNPDAVMPDPMVQALAVDPVVAYTENLANNVVGTSSYDLDGRRSTVRTREANEGNLIADALLWQANELASSYGVTPPDVAFQNGGGIRNDNVIPAGDITELDTFSMVPFPNFLAVIENIPRAQLKEILENAVACTQSSDFALNPNCGSGRYAQIAGLTYHWSASGTGQILSLDGTVVTAGTRVQEAALDDGTVLVSGGAVVDGPDVTVATIDFLARGGDQYPYRGAPYTVLGVTYQQALANYIVDGLGGMIDDPDYAFDVNNRIFALP